MTTAVQPSALPIAKPQRPFVGWRQALAWVVVGAGAFHLAYAIAACAFLIGVYVYAACALTGVATLRRAVYFGLALGVAIVAPQLAFFWEIFGPGAIGLWLLMAVCIAMFIVLGWRCRKKLHPTVALLCLPVLWTGIEYARSELYYLRFSWLTPGLAFAATPGYLGFAKIGVYGIGFILAASAAGILCLKQPWQQVIAGLGALALLPMLAGLWNAILMEDRNPIGPYIAGVQMEHPYASDVLEQLEALRQHYPKTDLFVLSEYTFDHEVPAQIKDWCAHHHTYLILGAVDQQTKGWYNTAFVIGPEGKVVFKQAKAVPIQFMQDGLRARAQKVWHSPWGAIGICICYDLSYSRVVDKLVRQGAQALIVPAMDPEEWGVHQHALDAQQAPMRAAEYGIPIFRVASSGISQWVDRAGVTCAATKFPGPNAQIAGMLNMRHPGTPPIDRTLAPLCVGMTGGIILWLIGQSMVKRLMRIRHESSRRKLPTNEHQ